MIASARKAINFVKARRESGLSEETMLVLLVLHDGEPRPKDKLALDTEINPTTLPRYVAGLIQSGHVMREQCQEDRRAVRFLLTKRGEKLAEPLLKHFPADD